MPNDLMAQSPGTAIAEASESTSVAVAAQQSREQAEIQSALMIAANRPRNEMLCIDAIRNACQRPRLAEKAEYSYSKGGQAISGANITLMTEIARHWGNIKFGFRELSRSHSSSEVEAYAWDLETNTQRNVLFTVKHRIDISGGKTKKLTSDRDIYEWISNQAQRRVRTCLESVIPRDIVEDARDECKKTLAEKYPVTAESIAAMVKHFTETYRVTSEMIEARIQRRIEAITPAQFVSMRNIVQSLKDGMSKPSDWFEFPEVSESKVTEKTEKSEAVAKLVEEAETASPADENAQEKSDLLSEFISAIARLKKPESVKERLAEFGQRTSDPDMFAELEKVALNHINQLSAA